MDRDVRERQGAVERPVLERTIGRCFLPRHVRIEASPATPVIRGVGKERVMSGVVVAFLGGTAPGFAA
ncbi:hypothetical protein ACFY4I_24250 [Streptomyces scabiei]|uniref:hypothetical protein n=1 Tax=Streptomyces scabiei TaxID=1930 RepID=UPI0036B3B7E7